MSTNPELTTTCNPNGGTDVYLNGTIMGRVFSKKHGRLGSWIVELHDPLGKYLPHIIGGSFTSRDVAIEALHAWVVTA